MSFAETPVTDVEQIKSRLEAIESRIGLMEGRFDGQAQGINSIGANLQWLIENVQGIFQMFSNPNFISQMSNMVAGGLANAGNQPGPEAGGAEAPSTGTDPGAD